MDSQNQNLPKLILLPLIIRNTESNRDTSFTAPTESTSSTVSSVLYRILHSHRLVLTLPVIANSIPLRVDPLRIHVTPWDVEYRWTLAINRCGQKQFFRMKISKYFGNAQIKNGFFEKIHMENHVCFIFSFFCLWSSGETGVPNGLS